jgi:hypothetical protein
MDSKRAEIHEEYPSDSEADSYSRGAPVTGVRLVPWLRLPPVSGLECAAALRRAGFRLRRSPPGIVNLSRDDDLIPVPLATRLELEVLITVLTKAGIGPALFLQLLEE